MSSFLIRDETINKLVTFFTDCFYSNEMFKSEVGRVLKEQGYNLNYIENENPEAQRMVKDLKGLNINALNYRYNQNEEEVLIEFKEIEEKSIIQLLKHLQCFLYQCSEGEIPNTRIFKNLKVIEEILKNWVINEIPIYKESKWE